MKNLFRANTTAATEETKKNSALKNALIIGGAIGGTVAAGLVVKHFIIDNNDYDESEVTANEIQESDENDQNLDTTPDLESHEDEDYDLEGDLDEEPEEATEEEDPEPKQDEGSKESVEERTEKVADAENSEEETEENTSEEPQIEIQLSDENQAEPESITGETQTVEKPSADETKAADETSEGEIETSDRLMVPIMNLVEVPGLQKYYDERKADADKYMKRIKDLIPDNIPITAIQLSGARQFLMLLTGAYYDMVRENGCINENERKVRRFINNAAEKILKSAKEDVDKTYMMDIEIFVEMMEQWEKPENPIWRDRVRSLCDEVALLVNSSKKPEKPEDAGVKALPVDVIPQINEFKRRLETVRDLMGDGKVSEAREFYNANLKDYANDKNLPDDIKESIARVRSIISDAMITQKQAAATVEQLNENTKKIRKGKKHHK